MTDVRLTATNPEDSSVVPVACNAKGELKLEEVPTFDGNVEGDLTVSGSASFAGVTRIGDPDNADPTSADASGVRISNAGVIKIKKSAEGGALSVVDENDGTNAYIGSNGNADFSGNVKIGNYNPNAPDAADLGVYGFASGSLWINSNAVDSPVFIARKDNVDRVLLNSDGSGTFTGNVQFGVTGVNNSDQGSVKAFPVGRLQINGTVPTVGEATSYFIECNNNGADKFIVRKNGSVSFAGNKAGFTAEGYLWCTTRRGDTVILDFTSNGMATWAPYTPPNRLTDLQDRWSEKDGILPVPHESSQDEP